MACGSDVHRSVLGDGILTVGLQSIIGGRYYNSENFYDVTDFKSPRDSEGHGTHTCSTTAGNRIARASYYGVANGSAKGGVAGARIATYKSDLTAPGVDILAAWSPVAPPSVDWEDPRSVDFNIISERRR
ncbi:hypothetical protein CCACVL1_29631 [Corchorus capsularis]|uniref:Peptidase S8/S53 domain-containing protein n=1 Tax=Corchorus capsularis TaxID=210143 RepID=A0A1R3G0T1_COCAP|nr:hypothetical protein CCACVL1_29631 [Corchorus capsularis]